jgi:excisionase family DNA binding protein
MKPNGKTPKGQTEPPKEPACLKVQEVAARLAIDGKHVAELIEEGTLRAINVGTRSKKCWRIPMESLQAFIQKRDSRGQEGAK